MNDLRTAAQQALEALEHATPTTDWSYMITALRAALAQQADPTDPGRDVDVLREHVRHLEQRVRELHAQQAEPLNLRDPAVQKRLATQWGYVPAAAQAEPDAYGYASRLAVAIWEKHYKDAAPQWKPLDDLMGVLTQIDNMTSGLTRLAQQAKPVQEPAYKVKVTGRWHDTEPLAAAFSLPDGEHLLYTAPPQRRPLTEKEIDGLVIQHAGYGRDNFYAVARAVERAHGIKE